MRKEEQVLVLERLRELEGWAEYITEELHFDQRSESVKREVLERTLDGQALRKMRELSTSLRYQLQMIAARLELSRSSQKDDDVGGPWDGPGCSESHRDPQAVGGQALEVT